MGANQETPLQITCYTIPEAAQILKVSVRTLRDLIYAREISYVQKKDGAKITLRAQALMDYLAKNEKRAA